MVSVEDLSTYRHETGAMKREYEEAPLYDRPVYPYPGPGEDMTSSGWLQPAANVPPHLSRRVPPSPEWSPAPSTDSGTSDSMHTSVQQQPSYIGYIKSPADAVLLLAACDMPCSPQAGRANGIPRRIYRRLLDDERASLIQSGSIFVWDEREASMRRWTDGRCWSASRVSGCFLTYRELEMRKKSSDTSKEGPMQNLYKSDGLIKQSFSITTASNRKLHVISYFRKQDVRMGLLRRVSEDPRISTNGPGSWRVHVDEKEFGELLSRENETLPESVRLCSPGELPLTPTQTECRGMKRTHGDYDGDEAPAKTRVSPVEMAPRRPMLPSPPYGREYESRLTYPSSYIPGEDARRYRYEHPGSYTPYPSSAYAHTPPYAGSLMHSRNASRVAVPMRDVPPPPPKMPPGYSMPRHYAPTPNNLPPPPSDMEQDSIEALVSLRNNTPTGSATQPFVPLLSRDSAPVSRMRPRAPPVSASDRDALQKLSVRV